MKDCKVVVITMLLNGIFRPVFTQSINRFPILSENFITNESNWIVGDRAKTNAHITDGYFFLESKRNNSYSRRTEAGFLRADQDYEIEIRFKQTSGTNQRGYALEWGGNSMDNYFYNFWLRNDGSYSIDKIDRYTNNAAQFTDFVPWTKSALVKVNDFNILTVRKVGKAITYLINGSEVYSHTIEKTWGSEVGFTVPPKSVIQVDYINVNLISGKPRSVFSPNIPNIWVVVVGINQYADSFINNLSFATNDAKAIENFYKHPNAGDVASENITVLLDKDATKANILNSLKEKFTKAKPNDLLVLYFAGHGKVTERNGKDEFLFIPNDYDAGNATTGIMFYEIKQLFDQSKATKKMCVIDACHSGGTLPELKGKNIKEIIGQEDSDIALLTSANTGETALELTDLERGLFSYFVTRGLIDDALEVDENNDKIVSILELYSYVKAKTKEKANATEGHKQTPQIGGKFNIQLPLSEINGNRN